MIARVTTFFSLFLVLGLSPVAQGTNPVQLSSSLAVKKPYSCVGQVFFKSGSDEYIGSGTIVARSSVLTAGHNLYDADTGWSTNFEYYQGTYGSTAKAVKRPTRRLLFAGYQKAVESYGPNSVRSFASDAAGLTFAEPFTGRVPLSSDPAYLSKKFYKMLLGYGAEGAHDGDYPLVAGSSAAFYTVYGKFAENYDVYVEGGMSGGPLLVRRKDGLIVQVGIVVSGSTRPRSGGVRLIDGALARFIKNYLY